MILFSPRGCIAFVLIWIFLSSLIAFSPWGHAQTDGLERFDFIIQNGRITDTRKTITVKRGDPVEINWRVDRVTTLHLHGYDLEITVWPDKSQTMDFTARATGRFAIEMHSPSGHHAVLIYLEVHPP